MATTLSGTAAVNAILRRPAMQLSPGTISVISTIVLFASWALVSWTGLANPLFLPGPDAVAAKLYEIAVEGYQGSTLLEHLATSLGRILSGFGLACIVGIPLGIVMGLSVNTRAALNPLIEFYRPLPPLGLYTVLVMWLGIGEESKLALLFLAGLPGIIIATTQAASSIDQTYIRVARSLGATRSELFWHVYLPGAGPIILTGMRISLGFTYTVLVAAEIVAATAGIGWMIWDAAKFLLSDVVIGGLFVLGLTGIALDLVMRSIGSFLMPWTRA